jgi:hypothetical protein
VGRLCRPPTPFLSHAKVTKYAVLLRHFLRIGKKVKVTLVQALRLCTGPTAHRGSRGIALLFHDQGTRRG